MDEHSHPLLGVAVTIDEALKEEFEVRLVDSSRDRERFRAWVVRMTFRMALDRQRANRRRAAREHGSDGLVGMRASESTHDGRDRAEQLWRAIDGLSEKLRRVVVLARIEGHNLREVGLLLGLPEGTVKSRLFLARKELKERLS
jgi:RNA polymerase sigma-70 factor (ECF subfamily)